MSLLGPCLLILGFVGVAISYSHKNSNLKLWFMLLLGSVFVFACTLIGCEFLPRLEFCFILPDLMDPNGPPVIRITPIP